METIPLNELATWHKSLFADNRTTVINVSIFSKIGENTCPLSIPMSSGLYNRCEAVHSLVNGCPCNAEL